MTPQPDVLYALAQARQREAAAWAERRRLVALLRRKRREPDPPPSPASPDAPHARLRAEQRGVQAQAE
jgi:hypothetical protein